MAEYIEKEKFIKWVDDTYCKPCEEAKRDYNHCRCGSCQYDDMMCDVESFESADVAPVRHGRWIPDYDYAEYDFDGSTLLSEPRKFQDGWQCSLCGQYMPSKTNYCPNCGAYMGEEGEQG